MLHFRSGHAAVALCLALFIFSGPAFSQSPAVPFFGNMEGGGGSGAFTATYQPSDGCLDVSGTYEDMDSDATVAHVHRDSDGSVVLPLSVSGGTSGTFSGCGVITGDDLVLLLGDGLYINVHTLETPAGQISGAVELGTTLAFSGTGSGNSEVPPVESLGSSTFTAEYDRFNQQLFVEGSYENLGTVQAAHVHNAPAGSNGGVVFGLSHTGGSTGTFSSDAVRLFAPVSGDDVAALLNGDLYVNIHTESAPGGEVRGQINLEVTTLPVELVSFEASAGAGHVLLEWTTASESDNAGFEAQIRQNGVWTEVGFIAGQGTTTESTYYTHRINNLDPGTHRFRLKQVDFEGGFAYSPVIAATLEIPGGVFVSTPHPNPFQASTTMNVALSTDERIRIEAFDLLGRSQKVLFDGPVVANEIHSVTLHSADLPAGTYVVRLLGDQVLETRLVTLVK